MLITSILDFLTELKENNSREWFLDNKSRYDFLRLGFESYSDQLIASIAEFDKDIKNLVAKDCIFRIHRDIRFSNDKTPYKTHFGVFIASDGGRKSQRGGYYLHIDPAESFVGCGVWCPQPDLLKALRQSVFDNYDEFVDIRKESNFAKYFSSFFEEGKLKTIPRGFPKDFPEPDLLKLKHYLVSYKLNEDILKSEESNHLISEVFKAAHSFNSFLNHTVDEVK
jgi:uncharacterized protein (TIGR02453 family)